jgi:hypothetical protein
MAAGGAGVCEDSFVIDWVDPHSFKDGFAEVRVSSPEVGQMNVSFGGVCDESQVERGGGITSAADSNESAGVQRRGREHVVMGWWWGTSGTVRAYVN